MSPVDVPPPAVAPPRARPAWGTAATIAAFLVGGALLGVLPGVPQGARLVDLRTSRAREDVLARLRERPRMGIADVERRLAADDAIPALNDDDVLQPREDDEGHDAAEHDDAAASAGPLDAAIDRAAVVAGAVRRADRALALDAAALHAPGGDVDNPCVQLQAGRCVRTALDDFFAALDARARNVPDAQAHVVVFGNSLIASDHVVDVVRSRLVRAFGDGGRGYLLPERLSKSAGRRSRTGTGTDGWSVHTFASEPQPDAPPEPPFGFAGSLHEATSDGETTTWSVDGARRARLFWLESPASMALRVDDREVARIPGVAPHPGVAPRARDASVELPADAQELRLVGARGAKVYGVALERDSGGVVVDTIGVPAASARLFTEAVDAPLFIRQLATRTPSLVVMMLGGNEARSLGYRTLDEEHLRAQLETLVARMRQAAPDASCLIVTPIDAVTSTVGGELVSRPELARVIDVQRQVAAARGCAVFDLHAAMGGAGSLARFQRAGLLSPDLVHPTSKGGDVLGHLVADALLRSYVSTPLPRARRTPSSSTAVVAPRLAALTFPPDDDGLLAVDDDRHSALSRFLGALQALERGERRRVAVGILGDELVDTHGFGARVRAGLAQRFGLAGPGYLAANDDDEGRAIDGVQRQLQGAVDVLDARRIAHGADVGMAGTRMRLGPGARFHVALCPRCDVRAESGRLQLTWLALPGAGHADVLLDGAVVAQLPGTSPDPTRTLQVLTLPLSAERATLDVVVADNGARKHVATPRADDSAGPPLSPRALFRAAVHDWRSRPRAASRIDRDGDGDGNDDDTDNENAVDDTDASPSVYLLGVSAEMDRAGVVVDTIGRPRTTGMTMQRARQAIVADELATRHYDLLVTAWGAHEATLASLDDVTYRTHLRATLHTLRASNPAADCLVVGAAPRGRTDGSAVGTPAAALVDRVQRDVAAGEGCAFFAASTALRVAMSSTVAPQGGSADADGGSASAHTAQMLADELLKELMARLAWETQRDDDDTPLARAAPDDAAGRQGG